MRRFFIIVASAFLTSSTFLSVVQPVEGTSSNNNNRKSHLRRKRLNENVGLLMQVDGDVDGSVTKKEKPSSSTHHAAAVVVHKTSEAARRGRNDQSRDLDAADEEFGREQKQQHQEQQRHNQERKQMKSMRQDKELSDAIAAAEEVMNELFDDNRYLQVVSMSMSMVGGRTDDYSSGSYNSQEGISSSAGARVPTSPFNDRPLDTPETPTQIASDEEVTEENEIEQEATEETEVEEEVTEENEFQQEATEETEAEEEVTEEDELQQEVTEGTEVEEEATDENELQQEATDENEIDEPVDGRLDAPEIPSSISSNTTEQETNIAVRPSTNSTSQDEEEVQDEASSSEATAEAPPSSPANDTNNAVSDELDVDRFDVVLTYQSQPGVCSGSASGIGCAGEATGSDMGGNPNTLLNCYDVTSFATVDEGDTITTTGTNTSRVVELKEVKFWIGESSDLPRDLSVRVWDSVDGTIGSGPNNLLFEQDVLDYSVGENTIFMDVASGDGSLIPENGVVCVGVYSESVQDGLRIQTESPPADVDTGDTVDPVGSFLMTPSCGLTEFTSLADLTVRGGLCIEAIVSVTTTTTTASSSVTSSGTSVETGKL